MLDLLGYSLFPKGRRDNKTGVGHILFMFPCFDITKAYPRAFGRHGNDGFALVHFLYDVLGRALGNARSACLGRLGHLVGDGLGIMLVVRSGLTDDDVRIHWYKS